MSLSANPEYRLISAPVRDGLQRVALSPLFKVLRAAGMVFALLFLASFVIGGTMESRVTYVIAFTISILNPIWGMYAIALMGPLFLTDQSNHHLLGELEVIAVGMIAGELRLLGTPVRDTNSMGQAEVLRDTHGNPLRVHWGLWPFYLLGLFLVLMASAIPGFVLIAFKEYAAAPLKRQPLEFLSWMFFGPATVPEWTAKCLWNWGTGMLLATIIARRANPLVVARWLKLGGISLVVACLFGLLEWKGWMSLSHIRRPNPDPLQAGRLQGLAGHPGWFGQWIVMMWPGLLLWWSAGRTKRNTIVGAALCMVVLTLVLTAARAAWLGFMVAGGVGALYLLSTFPFLKKKLLLALIIGAVLTAIGVIAGGDVLYNRVIHLLRTDDRANYYVSGLLFLRQHPFGIGLGMHYQVYEWMITPFYRWAQMDHVDSHSLWLNTLIENGPFVPLILAACVVGVALEWKKARGLFDPGSRMILVAVCLSFVGLLTISVAQYLPYIRVVEICTWLSVGSIIGLCRKQRCRVGEPVESWGGRRILLGCGCCALIVASMNVGRINPGNLPRVIAQSPEGLPQFWTGAEWTTPVNADIDGVTFSLYRKATTANVEILWPDGKRERVVLQPEERRPFAYHQIPHEDRWFAPQNFLTIRVTPLWTPSQTIEGSTDNRHLGIYVSDLNMTSRLRH